MLVVAAAEVTASAHHSRSLTSPQPLPGSREKSPKIHPPIHSALTSARVGLQAWGLSGAGFICTTAFCIALAARGLIAPCWKVKLQEDAP